MSDTYKIKDIPSYSAEILNKIISSPDVPNAMGGFEPVNAELKRVAAAELRKRKIEAKQWYEKPFGLVFIGVLIVLMGYLATEFVSSLRHKPQQEQQRSPEVVSPNDPKKIP